jgi:hypothetical protein
MELTYKQTLAENNLRESDLPEDARIGIEKINDIMKGFALVEKKGKKPTDKAMKTLKAMDKWVSYEILDFVGDRENNDEMPENTEQVVEELQEQANGDDSAEKKLGQAIETEMEEMFKTGKTKWDVESIKGVAPKVYNLLYKTYDEEEENGIETSAFTLIETEEEVFTLNKK